MSTNQYISQEEINEIAQTLNTRTLPAVMSKPVFDEIIKPFAKYVEDEQLSKSAREFTNEEFQKVYDDLYTGQSNNLIQFESEIPIPMIAKLHFMIEKAIDQLAINESFLMMDALVSGHLSPLKVVLKHILQYARLYPQTVEIMILDRLVVKDGYRNIILSLREFIDFSKRNRSAIM